MSERRNNQVAILASSKRQIEDVEHKRNVVKVMQSDYPRNQTIRDAMHKTIARLDNKIAEMKNATRIYERDMA